MPFIPRPDTDPSTIPAGSGNPLSLEQARQQWGYNSFEGLLLRSSIDPVPVSGSA
jgi:hypothetical protein